MAKHMEQTLPANLQYYQKSGGYVPPHIQQQMAKHMEQTMPAHLKGYINPYMQQHVVGQHLGAPPAGQATHFSPNASTAFAVDHQHAVAEQHGFEPHAEHYQPQPPPQPQHDENSQPPAIVTPPETSTPLEPYAFITNPEQPIKPPISLLGIKLPMRWLTIAGGGAVGLIIVLSILKSLLGSSFNLPPFVAILQDQQELIHLTTNAAQSTNSQAVLSPAYQNFVATTELTVTSAQAQMLQYVINNKQKIPSQELNLKESVSLDNELTAAATNGDYTSTLQQVMSTQLNTYLADLQSAYAKTSGKKGHAQIKSDFDQATLLLQQLNQASGASS
jgi:hypothetical protein